MPSACFARALRVAPPLALRISVRRPPLTPPLSRRPPPLSARAPAAPVRAPAAASFSTLACRRVLLRRAVALTLSRPTLPRAPPVSPKAPCRTRDFAQLASGAAALLSAFLRYSCRAVAVALSAPTRAHPVASPRTPCTGRLWTSGTALATFARPMAFYVLFALLALCSGQTTSPTTSPSPTRTPSCSAPPGYFCSGGSSLICPIGTYCAGGSALNVSCYPVTACTVAGLSAQPPCYWKVSTLAGNGVSAFVNSDNPFTSSFNAPSGPAHFNISAYCIGDSSSIRVIDDGGVRALAGKSAQGSSNGIGTTAGFRNVAQISSHPNGNIVLADAWNHAIRMVTLTGTVSTLAGSLGSPSFLNAIGTNARFSYPQGVCVSILGTIYVADAGNHRIRYFDIGSVTSTLAGSGASSWLDGVGTSAAFSNPIAVALSPDNSMLYVADHWNHRIRKIFTLSGFVSTLAGGGSAAFVDGIGTLAQFYNPAAISADALGRIFVADSNNNRVRLIIESTGLTTTVSGNGTNIWADGFSASFNAPQGIFVNNAGSVIVSDTNNRRIRQLTCVPCPSSYYCFSGAPVLCPAGSSCPLSSINATWCAKGTYSNAGASNCTLCSAGTFASTTGSTSCQQCPGGHYCPAGTSSWARLNCGRGNYCPDGSGTPTPCPYQVPPTGGWGDLKVQGPAFLVETSHCLNHCFWNFTSGDGMLSKC